MTADRFCPLLFAFCGAAMKPEIDRPEKIATWLKNPEPAIFQGQDLRKDSATIAAARLDGCVFLGCLMEPVLAKAVATAGCFLLPSRSGLPFDPFSPGLYTPLELYNNFDPDDPDPIGTYHRCFDWLVYNSVVDPATKIERPVDVDVVLMRRIHDFSMTDSLDELLEAQDRRKCVAIMGGHDRGRDEPIYEQTARLALTLTNANFFVVTGGGPGLMEAANLGAYAAGFPNPEQAIASALPELKKAPLYNHPDWLKFGFKGWQAMKTPSDPEKSRSLGVPTWFYGHEPPNVFATDIAKYFENSVREEGLLSLAQGGIVYAEGNGGTVQEIFQDANQNYYRTYAKTKSPMVLFNTAYWNPAAMNFNDPADKRKQVYLLLHKLATEKRFDDYLFLSDDATAVVQFIKDHPPVA
jgi:predicted Rossmann-fold nucleotide-binding protein